MLRLFRRLKAVRSTRDHRLADLARPLYSAALRLAEDATSAEDLVLRACRVFGSRLREEGGAGEPGFELLAALYSAHRETHGPPIHPGDIQRALTGSARESARPGGPAPGDLAASLDRLPPALWHPLWLRDNRGASYEQIAILLDLTPADVLRLISRARRRVATEIGLMTPERAPDGGAPAARPDEGWTVREARSR
jgi:DNA-directed RNA polymerase specialized sigma24 family protein